MCGLALTSFLHETAVSGVYRYVLLAEIRPPPSIACWFVVAMLMDSRVDIIVRQTLAPTVAVDLRSLTVFTAFLSRVHQTPLGSVSMPTALVKVTVALPRYSTPGESSCHGTRDQSGSDPAAKGIGLAVAVWKLRIELLSP